MTVKLSHWIMGSLLEESTDSFSSKMASNAGLDAFYCFIVSLNKLLNAEQNYIDLRCFKAHVIFLYGHLNSTK